MLSKIELWNPKSTSNFVKTLDASQWSTSEAQRSLSSFLPSSAAPPPTLLQFPSFPLGSCHLVEDARDMALVLSYPFFQILSSGQWLLKRKTHQARNRKKSLSPPPFMYTTIRPSVFGLPDITPHVLSLAFSVDVDIKGEERSQTSFRDLAASSVRHLPYFSLPSIG